MAKWLWECPHARHRPWQVLLASRNKERNLNFTKINSRLGQCMEWLSRAPCTLSMCRPCSCKGRKMHSLRAEKPGPGAGGGGVEGAALASCALEGAGHRARPPGAGSKATLAQREAVKKKTTPSLLSLSRAVGSREMRVLPGFPGIRSTFYAGH